MKMMKPPKKILLDSRHVCGLNLVFSLIFLDRFRIWNANVTMGHESTPQAFVNTRKGGWCSDIKFKTAWIMYRR